MSVPPPPATDLPRTTLAASTRLYRVHDARFKATEFNPGKGGPTRFAFFDDEHGNRVPVLYAGEDPQVAVFETVFHDTVPGQVVHRSQWQTRVLTALETTTALEVALFHSVGLRRLGLHARDLTDTPPTAYSKTVAWAQAAHRQGLAGCVWMSRQHNTGQAWVLFGDRVPAGALQEVPGHPERRVFAMPADEGWLAQRAEDVAVTLMLH